MPDAAQEMNDRALNAAMAYIAEQSVTSVAHMGTRWPLAAAVTTGFTSTVQGIRRRLARLAYQRR
ncbi:MAG: hypothetical protein ABI229_02840 [Gemmatimonadaceae bacterium]